MISCGTSDLQTFIIKTRKRLCFNTLIILQAVSDSVELIFCLLVFLTCVNGTGIYQHLSFTPIYQGCQGDRATEVTVLGGEERIISVCFSRMY